MSGGDPRALEQIIEEYEGRAGDGDAGKQETRKASHCSSINPIERMRWLMALRSWVSMSDVELLGVALDCSDERLEIGDACRIEVGDGLRVVG